MHKANEKKRNSSKKNSNVIKLKMFFALRVFDDKVRGASGKNFSITVRELNATFGEC